MNHLKVRGHDNLVRDPHSKAILNTDKAALEKYLADRELVEKQKKEKTEFINKIQNLEDDMKEIKSLLRDLTQMRTANGN